jgi:hypothetical protein
MSMMLRSAVVSTTLGHVWERGFVDEVWEMEIEAVWTCLSPFNLPR